MRSPMEMRGCRGTVEVMSSPQDTAGRDAYLDNAKLALVVLVVVGHTWTELRDVFAIDVAYFFVYLFHMPAFVLIAGYLSRNVRLTWRTLRGLVLGLCLPYVVFEFCYETFRAQAEHEAVQHNLLAPTWIMWFLVALLLWRLSAPAWRRLPGWFAIPLAVAVSLVGGLCSTDTLAVAKTLGLVPFFVIGLWLSPRHFAALRTPMARVAAVPVLAAAVAGSAAAAAHSEVGWVRWQYNYGELGTAPVPGMAVRLGLLAAACAVVAAVLSLVPAARTRLTGLGAHTLYAYLLHGAGVLAVVTVGGFAVGWLRTPWGLGVVSVAAVAAALALMTRPARWVSATVVEPGRSLLGTSAAMVAVPAMFGRGVGPWPADGTRHALRDAAVPTARAQLVGPYRSW